MKNVLTVTITDDEAYWICDDFNRCIMEHFVEADFIPNTIVEQNRLHNVAEIHDWVIKWQIQS